MVNHKRVRRLYREEGLNLRIKRPRRHVSAAHRVERLPATAPNEIWPMDSFRTHCSTGAASGH
jgi:putative transposase